MASNPPTAQDGRRDGRPEARRRRGLSLAVSAVSMTAGGVGGSYLAGVRLTYLGRLTHLSLPHDALLLLIIAIIVLGWRVIVYLERHDRHHREIICGMRDQEGVYQKYEDRSISFIRRPTAAAAGRDRQGASRPGRSRPRRADKAGHGDVVPFTRHQRAAPSARPRGRQRRR